MVKGHRKLFPFWDTLTNESEELNMHTWYIHRLYSYIFTGTPKNYKGDDSPFCKENYSLRSL